MAKQQKQNKADLLAYEVARLMGVGKPAALQTVDFMDPNRPKTCLEVDFPILPINQVATLEGNAGKPIYQMSKWWARRRSSVFRSMLISSVVALAVDPEGKRSPPLEKAADDIFHAEPAPPGLSREEARTVLTDVLEPMLLRDLSHRGVVREGQPYQAELVGWVEVSRK